MIIFKNIDLINIFRNRYLEKTFTFANTYPLAGKLFLIQVRKSASNETLVLEFNMTDGTLEVNGQNIIITQTADKMTMQPGTYEYDIKSFTDGTDGISIVAGLFTVSAFPTT